jgi:MFS family permease
LDHAGAVVGPLLASAILAAGGELRLAFALAAIPGILSVLVLLLAVEERADAAPPVPAAAGPRASLGRPVRLYLGVLVLFTLGNSSDAFLLLRAQEAGLALAALPLLWTFHHVVKAAAGTHGGALSDRIGRRRAIALGWLVYALAYAGLARATAAWEIWVLFGVYGLHAALTEGAEKALLADLAPSGAQGAAFGAYHAVTGAALLPASRATGWLWQTFGSGVALGAGAGLALLAGLLLVALVPEAPRA